jgi:hypothetical protein
VTELFRHYHAHSECARKIIHLGDDRFSVGGYATLARSREWCRLPDNDAEKRGVTLERNAGNYRSKGGGYRNRPLLPEHPPRGRPLWEGVFPSVRFQTADGRTVEFENKLGTNAPPRVGERVTVLYDPERPEDAKVAFGSVVRRNVMAFAVMGAIILGVMFSSFMLFVGMLVLIAVS